jgi:hypothetical protein
MVGNIEENGNIKKGMVKVFIKHQTVRNIRENGSRIEDMVEDYKLITHLVIIRENGKMINIGVMVLAFIRIAEYIMEIG